MASGRVLGTAAVRLAAGVHACKQGAGAQVADLGKCLANSLNALARLREQLPGTRLVSVADREGDVYDSALRQSWVAHRLERFLAAWSERDADRLKPPSSKLAPA